MEETARVVCLREMTKNSDLVNNGLSSKQNLYGEYRVIFLSYDDKTGKLNDVPEAI
jgi:hypothetical protein